MEDIRNTNGSATLTTSALANSAALLAGGILAMTGAVSFGAAPLVLNARPLSLSITATLGGFGVVMLAWAMLRLPAQVGELEDSAESLPEPERSTRLYGMYLVGIGFFMLVQALMCSAVFASVSWSVGRALLMNRQLTMPINQSSDGGFGKLFGSNAEEAFFIVGLFALSSLVAILGALFFFSNALWKKVGQPDREHFDRRLFWGGLWFRMGEAVLFNLVIFLVLRYYAPDQVLLLPLVSLLVGMFLKAGESLVSGVATRVFASIQSLVPSDLGSAKLLKLLSLKLHDFAEDEGEHAIEQRMKELVVAVKALAGVEQVEADAKWKSVRVEYDASVLSAEDIRRKVELKGLRVVS